MALRTGAEEAEVFGLVGRSVEVDLRREVVEMASVSVHLGLGLRAVVDGAVGFSSTSDLSSLGEVAKSAVRAARARGPDDQWRSLPAPGKVTWPKGIFDQAIDQISPEECIDLALDLLSGCFEVEGTKPVSGGVSCFSGFEFVVNSRGMNISEAGTAIQASMETVARNEDVSTGYEFDNSRLLGMEMAGIGRAAAVLARESLNGGKVDSSTYDVLLRPVAVADLLEYTLIPALSADNVQKGRSPLAERVGDKVASEGLLLADDGLLAGGMGTSGFDDEGVPSRRNVLIENGILKGFLYDSYTAGKEGRESTGNAVRAGYSEVPKIGVRNMILGSAVPFAVLSDTRRGVLINGLIGAHTANPISGDFSVEARNSFMVEDGVPTRPIKSAMIAGNVFDLLKDMDVGTDPRAVGSVVVPTVRVRMKVIG